MHYGWAVEGAIGSLHKIDASYLSAHVNMAARLEAATKQYGNEGEGGREEERDEDRKSQRDQETES